MNKNELLGVMKVYGDTQESLANSMGISRTTLNNKINGRTADFTAPEINFIRERYSLTPEKTVTIFFA